MIQAIKEDLYRYYGTRYSQLSVFLQYIYKPYTRYMYYFRREQFAANKLSRIFWRFLCTRYKYKCAVQIPPGTKIGHGFRLLHFGYVVVHPKVVIGNNCNIAQGVLLGESFSRGGGEDRSSQHR